MHEGLVEAQDEKAARDRDMKALSLWRRFITKIRILDHVGRIPEEQEGAHHPMTMMANDQSKAVEKGVVEVVEADEEEFGGFRGGFYSVPEESEPPISRKLTKNPQSLKQRYKNLCASPSLTFAAKTTGKKTAKSKSKSTTTTKAKPSARKTRRRKVAIESDEEEEAEESEASDSNSFSRSQRRNPRSRKFNYKYNFDADSSDDYGGDDAAASSGGAGGGFLKQQENQVAPRRSTRLATAVNKATPVKYTLDEDDDDDDDLEPELEKQQQGEGKKQVQNNQKKKRASGGFLIGPHNSSSELSDAPSDLISEAEYEASVSSRAIESNPTVREEGHGPGGPLTVGSEKQDDEGDDGDEGEGGNESNGDAESRGAVGVFETPHYRRSNEDLSKTDYVMRDARPATGTGDGTVNTAKTDQEMVDYNSGGDDHNDNDIVVRKSLPVENEAVVGPTAALTDTMAGLEKMHREEQTPSGGSSPMLSEDPEDKDNADLDWCNY